MLSGLELGEFTLKLRSVCLQSLRHCYYSYHSLVTNGGVDGKDERPRAKDIYK